MLVSIILPTYNRQQLLEKTFQSVFNQTYVNWELIVIDDCSTDDTEAYVRSVSGKEHRVKYVRLATNSGASKARNEGLKIASGEYITFIDSDDEYLPEKIEKQIRQFEGTEIQNLGIVTCGRQDFRDNVFYSEWIPSVKGDVVDQLFSDVRIGAGTPFLMIKRELIQSGVAFDANINVVEDFELLAQCLFLSYRLDYVAQPLVRVHHYSIDRNFNYDRAFKARDYLFKKYNDYLLSKPSVLKKFLRKSLVFYSMTKEEYKNAEILKAAKANGFYLTAFNICKKVKSKRIKNIGIKLINTLYK